MKNRRDVCMAKDAGFIEFEGLHGSIKSGCQATPDYMSRYCVHHKHQACQLLVAPPEQDEEAATFAEAVGPFVRHQHKQPSKHPGEAVVEVLVSKRKTRKETYYQVCSHYFSITL